MSLLEQTIQNVNNLSERIEWREYFMSLAFLISLINCHRLKVGCVLVNDTRVISVGYNGFLPGAPHLSIVRDNHETAYSSC